MGLDFGLGNFISAFGKTKQKPVYYNKALNSNLDALAGQFGSDNTNINQAWGAYNQQNPERMANAERQRGLADTDYTRAIDALRNVSPMGNVTAMSNTGKDWFNMVSGGMENVGKRNADMASRALYGATAPGNTNYNSIARASAMAPAMAALGSNLYNTSMGTAGDVTRQQYTGIGMIPGMVQNRMAASDYGYDFALDPARALLALRGAQTDLLGGQAGVAKSNTAGYNMEKDTLAKIGSAISGAGQGAAEGLGQVAGIAGSLFGVGGVGNLLGMGGTGYSGLSRGQQSYMDPIYRNYDPITNTFNA